ncbi:hypothetical protein AXX17_AT2G08620 [Arabidopsis thaliana]|uniref:DUF4283 domain-containing protein n=1 Tax=Arabidopsis thaliana TaxID=3702 RepID=A0A178VT93_ARATH|nr:hypothetical protein AXX17_AT2G08620 [Arabidopsis thaliana]
MRNCNRFSIDKYLKEMSIEEEEDKPIILFDQPQFSSTERNSSSLLSRFLNPENQRMSKWILEMHRIWRLYDRVRGIAVSKDRFEFIFNHEDDLLEVLKTGVWTQDDWCVVMEKWIEDPPPDYLRLTHDKLRCPFISPLDSNVLFEEISAPADIPSKDKKEESLPQHCTTLPPGLPKLMADAIKVYTPHPSVSALVTISSDVSSENKVSVKGLAIGSSVDPTEEVLKWKIAEWPLRVDSSFQPFRNLLATCDMSEVGSSGNGFTWGGTRNKQWIQCKLDRCFDNRLWFSMFPTAHQWFLEKLGSDHKPVLVEFTQDKDFFRGQFRNLLLKGLKRVIGNGKDMVEETVNHILFLCPYARQVWALSNILVPPEGFGCIDLENFKYVFSMRHNENISNETRAIFPWIVWFLWKNRNKLLFNGSLYPPDCFVCIAYEDSIAWLSAQVPNHNVSLSTSYHTFHWSPPLWAEVKCNIGFSWSKNLALSSASWVVRDPMENVLLHSRRSYSQVASVFKAKIKSREWALESM